MRQDSKRPVTQNITLTLHLGIDLGSGNAAAEKPRLASTV